MTPYVSSADDLALHGPRVLGFASARQVAARFGLDRDEVESLLLDHEARGWTRRSSFADSSGWHLTDAGKVENERRLADELDRAGARDTVARVHREFLPSNKQLGEACTRWQIRPTRLDPMAVNDHSDRRWDERVLHSLTLLEEELDGLCRELASHLQRFEGYRERYATALARAKDGDDRFVDSPEVESCHTVWIQFHEDLLATLGIPRGSDT